MEKLPRQIPVYVDDEGVILCDICQQPAKIIRPETKNRERMYACVRDAAATLGFGDSYRLMTAEEKRFR